MAIEKLKPAILVGSGLENFNFFEKWREEDISTPYGAPSSTLFTGVFQHFEVVILSRHGREHTIPPSQINNRANIWALKQVGCTHILSASACGSLREEYLRGDIVFPDQFIDFTRHRPVTFFDRFEPDNPFHAAMPDPFDESLKQLFTTAANKLGIRHHNRGTVITIEGSRFSTRAESIMFRHWGADIINMSTAPEAILANELKIPYALAALCTDYDAWREQSEAVSWEEVVQVFNKNINKISMLLLEVLSMLGNSNVL